MDVSVAPVRHLRFASDANARLARSLLLLLLLNRVALRAACAEQLWPCKNPQTRRLRKLLSAYGSAERGCARRANSVAVGRNVCGCFGMAHRMTDCV